jgi:hypothetical protein
LKQKNRKGVTKVLSISFLAGEEEKLVSRNVSGRESDLVVFLTPLVDSITYQKFLELLREEKKPDFFYSSHAREELKIYEKLLTSFFIQRILKRGEN